MTLQLGSQEFVRDARPRPPLMPLVMLCAPLAAVLLWKLSHILSIRIESITSPHQLDYGEGVVWQQMRSIIAGEGYGPIDGFPALVFHYPPVYHLVSWFTAQLTGLDELAAGRLVSLVSTLVASTLVGLIAWRVAPREFDPRIRIAAGLISGLIPLAFYPVQLWAALMRVDMLAWALALAGLYLSLIAVERPRAIYAAAAAFVLAVFTKQSMIAAPLAVFVVLLAARPRLAVAGIAACLVLGLVPLAALTVATEGGFLRHLFLYNINRFKPEQLLGVPFAMIVHVVFVGIAVVGLVAAAQVLRRQPGGRRTANPDALRIIMVLAYLFFALLTMLLIAKSGAAANYAIEGMAALFIFSGLGAAAVLHWLFSRPRQSRLTIAAVAVVTSALALQVAYLPAVDARPQMATVVEAHARQLEQMVQAADRPIISDDMVLLIRNGHPVVWEPAIFAELAGTGRYDPGPVAQLIRERRFAFFVTQGMRGDVLFDDRYSPEIADAIDAAYPVKRAVGRDQYIHLPHRQ